MNIKINSKTINNSYVIRSVSITYLRENKNNHKYIYTRSYIYVKDFNKIINEIDMQFQRDTGELPIGKHYNIDIQIMNFAKED